MATPTLAVRRRIPGLRRYKRVPVGTLPTLGLSILLWAIVFVVTLPLIWAIITSFEPDRVTSHYPPTIVPTQLTLDNYFRLFKILPYGRFYLNSLIVAFSTAFLSIVIAASAAYSLARFRTKASEAASYVGLAAYMLPGILIAVPIFETVHALHALDSIPALVGVYVAYIVPFAVWQLRSYFAGIPREVEEAAIVDGATRFEAFYMVVLPQALPGLIATGVFAFALAWNEFLFASLLLFTPDHQTLSAGLATVLIGQFNLYSWGTLMAAAVLMTVPILFVFIFVQRQLISGISSGAVKG